MKAWLAIAACAWSSACTFGGGGKVPETRYYQLAAPTEARHAGATVVVLEPLSTDGAYDDERIVYRASPYRLDYYQYHRWSAPPGAMMSDVLAQGLAHSGRFRAIERELTDGASVVVGGRVIALEEIDESKTRWIGHVALELVARDPRTGAALWTDRFDEREPLRAQSPEGLAEALSHAMSRIVDRAAPAIENAAAARPPSRD